MEKTYLSHTDVGERAQVIAGKIRLLFPYKKQLFIYAVPRGGIPAAYAVMAHIPDRSIKLINDAANLDICDVIIDDIIDTGITRKRFGNKNFFALVDKQQWSAEDAKLGWVVFPWEKGETDTSADDIIIRSLQRIGEDPNRDGLKETPQRVLRSWDHLYGGYKIDPVSVFKEFDKDFEYDQMVTLRTIEFYSTCEHHMLPFFGKIHVGYIPDKKVVGISKIARLVECFSRRLQVQERLTQQIADAIQEHLCPLGVGVIIEAKHFCMIARGVEKQNSIMVTSAMLGKFREDEKTRNEFLHFTTRSNDGL